MQSRVNIRGIEIVAVRNQREFVDFLLNNGQIRTGKLVAINAEKVITSEQDPVLQTVLRNAEYNYADGISIVQSIKRKYPQYNKIERIAGVELWEGLLMASRQYQFPIFLVGGEPDVLAQTAKILRQKGVNIVGEQNGYFSENQNEAIIQKIKKSGAKIVTVAMGSPKQEKWIALAQALYPNSLYMGVGGTYDVFVGKVKRAPTVWQKCGLEWLYRLLQQPTRWQRQLKLLKYAYYYVTKQL